MLYANNIHCLHALLFNQAAGWERTMAYHQSNHRVNTNLCMHSTR